MYAPQNGPNSDPGTPRAGPARFRAAGPLPMTSRVPLPNFSSAGPRRPSCWASLLTAPLRSFRPGPRRGPLWRKAMRHTDELGYRVSCGGLPSHLFRRLIGRAACGVRWLLLRDDASRGSTPLPHTVDAPKAHKNEAEGRLVVVSRTSQAPLLIRAPGGCCRPSRRFGLSHVPHMTSLHRPVPACRRKPRC